MESLYTMHTEFLSEEFYIIYHRKYYHCYNLLISLEREVSFIDKDRLEERRMVKHFKVFIEDLYYRRFFRESELLETEVYILMMCFVSFVISANHISLTKSFLKCDSHTPPVVLWQGQSEQSSLNCGTPDG